MAENVTNVGDLKNKKLQAIILLDAYVNEALELIDNKYKESVQETSTGGNRYMKGGAGKRKRDDSEQSQKRQRTSLCDNPAIRVAINAAIILGAGTGIVGSTFAGFEVLKFYTRIYGLGDVINSVITNLFQISKSVTTNMIPIISDASKLLSTTACSLKDVGKVVASGTSTIISESTGTLVRNIPLVLAGRYISDTSKISADYSNASNSLKKKYQELVNYPGRMTRSMTTKLEEIKQQIEAKQKSCNEPIEQAKSFGNVLNETREQLIDAICLKLDKGIENSSNLFERASKSIQQGMYRTSSSLENMVDKLTPGDLGGLGTAINQALREVVIDLDQKSSMSAARQGAFVAGGRRYKKTRKHNKKTKTIKKVKKSHKKTHRRRR